MSLNFKVEWHDAPGVSDLVERKTWARLVIEAAGADEPLTRCFDSSTEQLRDGVYGSVFPLVQWLVHSYWHLLNEAPRVPGSRSGRTLARFPGMSPWLRRHNLLTAREGFSLPDLSFARDGDYVVLRTFPDPRGVDGTRPVRFTHEGVLRLPVAAVSDSIASLITRTLEQVRDLDHPSVEALRRDWEATLLSMEQERELCEWASRMGLDPYDADELSDDVAAFLEGSLTATPRGLRTDLLDATDSFDGLKHGFAWLDAARSCWDGAAPASRPPTGGPDGAGPAHRVGYWAARAIRSELGMKASEGGPTLGLLASVYGLSFESHDVGPTPTFLDGMVAKGEKGRPAVIGPDLPYEDKAFRWSRALYMWRFGHAVEGARLVTRSQARLQRESRAFAAELLAPAAAIRRFLPSNVVADDDIRELASELRVRPKLVRHQIENHQLALIE